MHTLRIIFPIIIFISLTQYAQQLKFPRESQMASVSQRIGLTDITVNYSRPAVKGREIWGKLVPYNEVWRAGANENTTISFTDPVTINGNKLDAGIYGFHTLPGENEWVVIFSKQYTGWGSYAYDQKEDALRIKVKPEKTPFKEYLEFSFNDVKSGSAILNLSWEELTVPVTIEVDVKSVVVNNFRKDLLGMAQFQWQSLNQAANYCAQNNINLDEALVWIDKSVAMNRNFNNLNTKARLVELAGNKNEADELKAAAMQIATEADMNTYGYQLLGADKVEEAIKVFKSNIEKYPDSWNVYDSLGEAYMTKGDKKLALENYNIALSKVPDETNKKRIENVIKQLRN